MADDPVRIAQFWQAVEIFSPQSLPRLDQRNHTVDYQDGDRVPWGPRSLLREPDPGYVWRHQVYGGLYDLSRVRDALVSQFGQDQDEEPPPKGKSALFACTVDEKGFLVEDSMVVSACAWGTGRVGRGESPIGDMAADTAHYADSLPQQAKARAGVRVLGAALREAASEGVSGAASALRWQGYSGRSARSGSASPRLRRKRPSRWPSRWPSRPWTRKKARCPASRTTLTPEGRARTAQRQDLRREPELVLAWCRPDLIPPGRWVTATDRPLAFSQQLAVNRIMHQHGDGQPGLFAVNGQPGTGKTSMLRDVVAEVPVRRAAKLAGLRSPQDAFTGEMTT